MRRPIRRVVVEVPATTANLGAGYDALGLALEIVNRAELELRDRPGIEIAVEGEGAGELESAGDNRFVAALERGLAAWAAPQPADGWLLRMQNAIPLGRGLGSSGAATIAGLVSAATLAGRDPPTEELLALAVELEGHADNAAAALLGGVVAVTEVGGRWEAARFDPPDVSVVVFVPELRLATADMRRVLPQSVPLLDAVFNVGRVAVGVARLASGDAGGFATLREDRLHEPYRTAAFPPLPALLGAAIGAGALGAALSGSGSSVVAFADRAKVGAVAGALSEAARGHELPGRALITSTRAKGATVLEAE